jgi:Putative regulator of cell autolysis
MKLLDNHSSFRLFVISLVSAIFIAYPNISCLPWELSFLDTSKHASHLSFFFIRYGYFTVLIWGLLLYNLRWMKDAGFKERALRTLMIVCVTYGLFVLIMYLWDGKIKGFGSILLFQFFVVFLLTTFVGHVFMMYSIQRWKEQEIEQLKIENLQSRCNALANQINPHFFFNSLNSLTALIRRKDDKTTLAFVNKLSDVFRYILQSDKKGLVPLFEEIQFVEAFRYMVEVRFANKLEFDIRVDEEQLDLKLPVLSILPLIDNIVVHNTIDSDNKMVVQIYLNEYSELVVSNPIKPKISPSLTNGTGIRNLENRFMLLMNKQIRVENDGQTFVVYLPLK